VTDRIVQTTWTDGGPHQPLPPPDDTQGDKIADLEAKQEKLIGWLVEACQIPSTELWTFQGWRTSAGACEAAIREALETSNSGESREGGQVTIPRTQSRDLPDIVAAQEDIIADQAARIAELEAARSLLLDTLEETSKTLGVAWLDLCHWRQFARYNVRGALCGEVVPLPDPQRPTEAGLKQTEEVIAHIQQMLKAIGSIGVATHPAAIKTPEPR
jgi:hypothetical protein